MIFCNAVKYCSSCSEDISTYCPFSFQQLSASQLLPSPPPQPVQLIMTLMPMASLFICFATSCSIQKVRRGYHPLQVSYRAKSGNGSLGKGSSTCTALADIRGGGISGPSIDTHDSPTEPQTELESLLIQAEQLLSRKDANGAFALLAQAYPMDPTSPQIASMFQTCMEVNVETAQSKFNQWRDTGKAEFTEADLTDLFQDRMGLASLCIDKEQYDQAGVHLRTAIQDASLWLNRALKLEIDGINSELPDLSSSAFQHWQPQIDQARYLLYRTNAACCKWDTYFQDGNKLRKSLEQGSLPSGHVIRLLHPFDALKFPFVSLELASKIAESYAHRALESVGVSPASLEDRNNHPRRVVTAIRSRSGTDNSYSQTKLRIGYLSPDFTSRHPLAFLMQHVFRYHDKSRFSVHIYSLSNDADNGPEVKAIRESSDSFTYLSTAGKTPIELYQEIMKDEIDILVDLCGYAGTSIVAEIMASRCKLQLEVSDNQHTKFALHVAYMGFPGSMGSSHIWDYSVFDHHVVPPSLRQHYSGSLVYMPHCYFVNSHKSVVGGPGDGIIPANEDERASLRRKYGLHPSAFVYCCHSRPDKIDPSTFMSWIKALCMAREECKEKGVEEEALPVLWLLKSGNEMEKNLKNLVQHEFGEDLTRSLVFADIAERNEHLRRLACADLFLDTPAYGAHTLGVDALYMGVPMISLSYSEHEVYDQDLDTSRVEVRLVPTEKLASIVGSSLLRASNCDSLIVDDMQAFEDLMVKCATRRNWFASIRENLTSSRSHSPLFDTDRWVKNLETAFIKMKAYTLEQKPDIVVSED